VESHTRARSLASSGLAWPGLAWPGLGGVGWVGRRARAHDMRVNGPPKSDPSPCGGAATSPAASLQIIPDPNSLSPLFIAEPPFSSLRPDRRGASAIRRAGLRNPSSSRSCIGRGRIRFLGSVFTRPRPQRCICDQESRSPEPFVF
jgi:hypothetical protein